MTLHYASTGNLASNGTFSPSVAGFNLADVSDVDQLNALPQGTKGLVWLDESGGVTQSFIDKVTPFLKNPKLFGFYLTDEPDPTGQFKSQVLPSNLMAESDWIHAHFAGAKTFITMMNLGDFANPSYANTYNWNNTHIDLYGISAYPVWSDNSSNPDFNEIDRNFNAAVASGITPGQIVPIYQTFGGGSWTTEDGSQFAVPTAAQEQTMLNHWAHLDPNPVFDYAYAWGQQQGDMSLSALPDLQKVFLRHNTAAPGIQGTPGDDTITGGDSGNLIFGLGGNDSITGGAGNDTLFGGTGNDTLVGGAGFNILDGGPGADLLDGTGGTSSAAYLDATAGVSVNLLDPTTNTGDAAGDSYINIHDVQGSSFADTITADNSGDFINGLGGNDSIVGGNGDDTLFGGTGNDTLTGGLGADRFALAGMRDGAKTITDFSSAQNDVVAVSHIGFGGGLTVGALAPAHFVDGTKATAATGQFLWNSAAHTLSWDKDGTGPAHPILEATFTNGAILTAHDITVF